MKERMAKELKRAYSNLGLPDEVLKSAAAMVIVGLPEDADDAAIASRASEAYVADMLKSFQSHADKIRTDARKAAQKENKGVDSEDVDGVPSYIRDMINEQKKTNDLLTQKISDLEKLNNQRSFDEMVKSIGKELGLSDSLLDLCKGGLSSDSDETAIRDHLGKAKKTLADSGAKINEGSHIESDPADEEEKLRKDAEEWVKKHAKKESED